MAIVTLTTDFGTSDHYVAAMKGVLLTLAPDLHIVDITHDIRPQDVVHGAFVFRQAFAYFPEDTIHVIVVDPGVGGARRLLAARYAGQTILAPDNGVMSIVHHDFPLEALREIDNPHLFIHEPSATFHGRDKLAPVAGHLASGKQFAEVGPETDHLEVLNLADAQLMPDHTLRGYVVHIDRFGNLITNIKADDLAAIGAMNGSVAAAGASMESIEPGPQEGEPMPGASPSDALPGGTRTVIVGRTPIGPVRRTYSDVAEGEILALIGSADLLEISVNAGSAAARLRSMPGEAVFVQ
jgi:hypothetical protein